MLKLPTNSNLVQAEFWNGNNWLIVGFDYEDDLNLCKNKTNEKEKGLIKFLQLTEGKDKSSNISQTFNQELKTKHHQEILGKVNNDKKVDVKKIPFRKTTIKESSKKSSYTTKIEEENNHYNITCNTTTFRGGFLSASLPGNNRKEQLDYTAEVLGLDQHNNLLFPTFHEGNSWIIVYFNNQADLNKCVEDVNINNKGAFKMIVLSRGNQRQTTIQTINSHNPKCSNLDHIQTYKITDIPYNFSDERIKGALKPFGKIISYRKA